ncbi:molybdopterin cofactor-binding domain-containing protein [Alsobacter sp. KACC 23698]|uniref:Molybdopterin cofactor-binding domain-containing protein n=1 Tax=Alsobacter sp. KACC 23698 TaxID=3149229 RepID=A0AAU7JAZ5_9HYPH
MTALPADLALNPLLSRWFAVEADGAVTIRTGKVELGQGAVTAIAALAAAELGVPLSRLRVVAGDTRAAPDEGMTAGSLSVEQGGAAMRVAAAQIRTLFAAAAAARLGCATDAVIVQDGVFSGPGRNASLSYADLAPEVDLDRSAADLPVPELLGGVAAERQPRLDLRAKLTGAAFIQDLDRPGLRHGRVVRPPRPGAELVSLDRASVAALPGVVAVVVDGSFVGVVADREEDADHAAAAAQRLAAWTAPDLPVVDDEGAWMEGVEPVATIPVVRDDGEAAPAARRHEAAYSRPYLAHASIGPSTALAEWSFDGRLTVWSQTQGVYPLRAQLARVLELAPEMVDVVHAMGAGCYGHNGADDVALDAALLARAAQAPVLCRWTRADELSWSPFGAPMRIRLAAGLDAHGAIVDWTHEVWSPPHVARPGFGSGVNLLAAQHLAKRSAPSPVVQFPGPSGAGDRNAVPLYRVGRRSVVHHLLPQGPLRSSALRSLGAHGNVFAIESFLDELAALAGRDPLEFRLAHMEDPRARAVLAAAAEEAGWDPAEPGGEGEGRGLAFARYKNMGGYCAIVARVAIAETVRLTHVVAAVDCGAVVHRDGLVNQIEGGIVQAASWTLKEQVRWTAEGVATRSWADYPILRFSECPRIAVRILEPTGAPPLGAGECATGPTAAAIGNAVAHALGVRVRHMPLTPERIEAAIHASTM